MVETKPEITSTFLFAQLSGRIKAQPDLNKRVQAHIQAVTKYDSLAGLMNNGAEESVKREVLADCLRAILTRDYSKLQAPAPAVEAPKPPKMVPVWPPGPKPQPIEVQVEQTATVNTAPPEVKAEVKSAPVPEKPKAPEKPKEPTGPMGILLGRSHDISDFASKDASRYVIGGIHYNADKKFVEATDGRVLIRVPVVESDEFPPTKAGVTPLPVDCIIPTAAFKKAMGAIPKGTSLPVLQHIKLDAAGTKATLTTTDLDVEQAMTSKVIEGNYPNTEQVIPTETPKFSIALGAEYLKKIVDYAERHGKSDPVAIRFDFLDATSPVRFSIEVDNPMGPKDEKGKDWHPTFAKGVLMPMKLS